MGSFERTGRRLCPACSQPLLHVPADGPDGRTRTGKKIWLQLYPIQAARPAASLVWARIRGGAGVRFELFVATRYLRAKRRQAVVGVITAISIIGVAAGVASLIIALAITNGMRRDLQERLLGSTAHVELMRVASDGIRDWRSLT